jgi:hypothetical protein
MYFGRFTTNLSLSIVLGSKRVVTSHSIGYFLGHCIFLSVLRDSDENHSGERET